MCGFWGFNSKIARRLNKLNEDPQSIPFILYTDETAFHSNGQMNRRNFHYYDNVNLHIV